jgi:hypothetical protein
LRQIIKVINENNANDYQAKSSFYLLKWLFDPSIRVSVRVVELRDDDLIRYHQRNTIPALSKANSPTKWTPEYFESVYTLLDTQKGGNNNFYKKRLRQVVETRDKVLVTLVRDILRVSFEKTKTLHTPYKPPVEENTVSVPPPVRSTQRFTATDLVAPNTTATLLEALRTNSFHTPNLLTAQSISSPSALTPESSSSSSVSSPVDSSSTSPRSAVVSASASSSSSSSSSTASPSVVPAPTSTSTGDSSAVNALISLFSLRSDEKKRKADDQADMPAKKRRRTDEEGGKIEVIEDSSSPVANNPVP